MIGNPDLDQFFLREVQAPLVTLGIFLSCINPEVLAKNLRRANIDLIS